MAQLGAGAGQMGSGASGLASYWELPSTLFSGGKPSEYDYNQQAQAQGHMQRSMPMGMDPAMQQALNEYVSLQPPGTSAAAQNAQTARMDFASLIQRPEAQKSYMQAPLVQPEQPDALYQQVPGPSQYSGLLFTPFGQELERQRKQPSPFQRDMSVLSLMGF